MHISELTLGEVTYTHQDPDTGEFRTFAVQRIIDWIKENNIQKFAIPVDKEFASFIEKNRGIESHRLLRILFEAETALLVPIVIVELPDREHGVSHLIIDGNHRYLIAAKIDAPSIPGHVVKLEQIKQFLVEDVPVDLAERALGGFSGIE